jgi:hypothetical protein
VTFIPPVPVAGNITTLLGKAQSSTNRVSSVPTQVVLLGSGLTSSRTSVVSGRLRITSGCSYYLEAALGVLALNRPANALLDVAWYNTTTSTEIGSRLYARVGSDQTVGTASRSSRWAARALILASDFGANSTMDIELRAVACSPLSTTWYANVYQASTPEGDSSICVWEVS